MSKWVFITGCSSGIGAATVAILQAAGFRVIASARKTADVAALEASGIPTVLLDLTSPSAIQQAAADVLAITQGQLYALVNNAGYGVIGAVEDVPIQAWREQFETNLFGLIALTQQFIPVFRQQGVGRIINISSVLGLVSMPFRGAYNASKFALEATTDALRMELNHSGISVILIEPGPIKTAFRENARQQFHRAITPSCSAHANKYADLDASTQPDSPLPFAMAPTAVAKKIRRALTSQYPRARYYVTLPTYLMAVAKRLLPTWLLDRLLRGVA